MMFEEPPIVDVPSVEEGTNESTAIHGVVLAAGTSSRYGRSNKLLELIDGDPLVCHAVASFVESRLANVTVVLGHDRERVRAALREYDVAFRYNRSYKQGQSASVREGIEAAREASADAVIFGLGDMPNVSPTTVDALVESYERGDGSALAAGYDGSRGNPVLFDSQHFDALGSVTGDIGGRDILRNAPDAAIVDTADPGVLRDIDRPTDLKNGEYDAD
ncbi:nucleotidyltransferase family protein [Natrinema salifodinae]|uniref:Molybdenum cofactor cytidylyltransferase n=1 Tax=Natrinema salifodinae TaxID=1202768 RepID=A0A1I0QRB0_9EURY|nr:nucleotidyltransferase family protein [Natrinema salifodinae]SEW29859.1 molybdenum cofactor cytidylyltransferase [Natrinema salifodinae]